MAYTFESIEDNQIDDVLDRINAMRSQEENTDRCRDYSTSLVDASCRKAMVDWCFIVADSFDLSRETVGIGMSILDRYLSSGNGKSIEALADTHKFQLAAITSFYMAVKTHEHVQLGIKMLVKLCRGLYTESAITALERDILHALDWRVCVSSATPMEYVRQFLELISESLDVTDIILEHAKVYMDCATSDLAFCSCRASSIGIACLAGALDDTCVLSSLKKEILWNRMSNSEFDIASNEVRKVERQLLAKSIFHEPKRQSRSSLPRSSVNSAKEQPSSSPGSVLEAICY